MRKYSIDVPERLLAAALADLGNSLARVGGPVPVREPPRPMDGAQRPLLDGAFFGDEGEVSYLAAGARPLDQRWGELLYDLGSNAFFSWGSSGDATDIDLVGIARVSGSAARVIVRNGDDLHFFTFAYASWPSGIHRGAWDSICGQLGRSPGNHLHLYTESGWADES